MKHGRAARRQELGLVIWQGEWLPRHELLARTSYGEYVIRMAILEGGWATDTPKTSPKVTGWKRGPCLECWRVFSRKHILDSEGYRCQTCAAHAKWHRESVMQGVNLRAEREASRKRLAENPERRQALRGRTPNINGYYRGSGGTE